MKKLVYLLLGLILTGCNSDINRKHESSSLKQSSSSGSTNLILQKKIEKSDDITIGLICIDGEEYAFMRIGYSERGGVGLEKTENECEIQTKSSSD